MSLVAEVLEATNYIWHQILNCVASNPKFASTPNSTIDRQQNRFHKFGSIPIHRRCKVLFFLRCH